MKSIDSVVVAVDGESKCGKTTFIRAVSNEAQHQRDDFFFGAVKPDTGLFPDEESRASAEAWVKTITFNDIRHVSCGNAFRAAAYYAIKQEQAGITKDAFTAADTDLLREMLSEEGARELLQSDPRI